MASVAPSSPIVSLWASSLGLFLAGTAVSGMGIGVAFKGGVTIANDLAEHEHRAGLTATLFLAAYTGLTIRTSTGQRRAYLPHQTMMAALSVGHATQV